MYTTRVPTTAKASSQAPKPRPKIAQNQNLLSHSILRDAASSSSVMSVKRKSSADSIETIARRFLHDFTADVASSDVHNADHAAWWACTLRGTNSTTTSSSSSCAAANVGTRRANSSKKGSDAARVGEGGRAGGGGDSTVAPNISALVTPFAASASRLGAADDRRSKSSSGGKKTPADENASSDGNRHQVVVAADVIAAHNEPLLRQRQAQLTAFAREGCGSKLTTAASSKCTGQRRWDPSTTVVPVEDPLYALLHRRLEQEGFAEDFEAAQEKFKKRAAKFESETRKEDNARKDRELQWYLEVYRPKQKREALCEVESDARLEISEEEMTAFMRLKQRFWEVTRAMQLKEQRRVQREEAERIADIRRREAEERHVREWLARSQTQICEQEQARRRELVSQHDTVLLNLFDHASAEKERMARVRLAQLNRLRAEFNALCASEHDRRRSILALEATAHRHLAQLAITERSELFQKQRLDAQQECARARRESGRQEIDERARLLQRFVVGGAILNGLETLEKKERDERRKIQLERGQDLVRYEQAAELSKRDAREAYFFQRAVDLEQEYVQGRDDIARGEAAKVFDQLLEAFVREKAEIIYFLTQDVVLREEKSRDGILDEYHHFVVYGARHEAACINVMSEETEGRYAILGAEHDRIRDLVRNSLLASAQVREASERNSIVRGEHQAASRLIVESAIVRDALANERRNIFAKQLAHLERREQDARHDFVSDRLEMLSRLVDDALARLAELNRAQEAKLLQQALRLTSNFVGIGLAERGEYLQVETLVEGGPGQRGGLRLGDMVLAIGGIPVSSTLEMRSALKRTGFVSKNLEMIVRRFIPENGFENMETVRLETPPVVPTRRPEGKFLDDVEKISVLVSTNDPRFKQFPFYFDSQKKTTRLCLPLMPNGSGDEQQHQSSSS